ncbi:MAG: hypothetical protein AAF802_06655 [Planctomycetota bacterium]
MASGFPSVGWTSLLPQTNAAVDMIGRIVFFLALSLIVKRGDCRLGWGLILVALIVLILGDQQRLQPWAYQSALYALAIASFDWPVARRWIIAVAISIYAYSAAGKLDYQFVHTVGAEMVRAAASPLVEISLVQASKISLALPLSELLIACILIYPKTRWLGGWFAIALHLTLLLLLGPWGMNHSLGVLVWNGLLACQAYLLFLSGSAPPMRVQRRTPWMYVSTVLLLAALLLPCLERRGYWDHWPSWALYSPHNSRVELEVHETALEYLPSSLKPHVEDHDADRWHTVDIEQWSLSQRLVPIYPQARYQLAIAHRLALRVKSDDAIRAKLLGVADRFDGTRQQRYLLGRRQIRAAANESWIGPKEEQ